MAVMRSSPKPANILPLGNQRSATLSIGVTLASGERHDRARPNGIAQHHRSEQGVAHDHIAIHRRHAVAKRPEDPRLKRNRIRAQGVACHRNHLRHIEQPAHHVANRIDRSDRVQDQLLRHGELHGSVSRILTASGLRAGRDSDQL